MEPGAREGISDVVFILNGNAGSNRAIEVRDLIVRIAAEIGTPARIYIARSGSEVSDLARQAMEPRTRMMVAGGGDGTVNAVAAGLVGTNTVLGVLPLGTLNHFAKDVGIPLKVEEAVRTIFTGRIANVDVAEVNGHVFLNNSSIGLYPQIVRQRDEGRNRGYNKWVAFAQAVRSVLRRHSRLHVRLDLNDKTELVRTTPFVFVGSNRYEMRGLNIGARTSLVGGQLWVCLTRHAGRGNLLLIALNALIGRPTNGDLDAFSTQEIWIHTKRKRVDVATDGEVNVMDSPLHYRCRPRALRVVVPIEDGKQK